MNEWRLGNILADEEPWKVIKTIRNACKHKCMALQIAAALSSLANLLAPTAKKLSRILKIESPLNWNTIAQNSDLIPAGHQIGGRNCFAKIEDEEIQNK
jgi:methionyl-tRNA synthetase